MKKRILSIALILCMVLSFVPQVVFANSNEDALPAHVIVTFDANGHGYDTAPAAMETEPGSTVSAPEIPTAEGYTFGGWYTDKACIESTRFDFSAPIMQNITLYAKWTEYCKDENKDHACDICGKVLSKHTGGEATCTKKAVCEYCGKEYGELDSSNHAGGTKNHGEKPATYLDDGYTGDIYCVGCNKMISAGKVVPKLTHEDPTEGVIYHETCSKGSHNYEKKYEMPTEFTMGGTKYVCKKCGDTYWDDHTKKDTSEKIIMPSGKNFEFYITPNLSSTTHKNNVTDNPILQAFLQDPSGTLKRMEDDGIKIYKIIDGAEQTVVSKAENIVFRSDAPFDEFNQVMINGLVLDKKYYSVKKGSTIVTLNEGFAKEIPTGMHLFGIISKDGVAITTFTVDDTKSPQTGDNSHMALWIALLAASVFGLAGTAVYSKRKRVR